MKIPAVANITRRTAVIARQKNLTWFDAIEGERSAFHVTGAQSAGVLSIMESVLAPGAGSPLHHHPEEEVFFVIEGVATVMVDGVIHRACAGTTVFVPSGVPHAWKNATQAPVRMLATFTPGGIDAMFVQFPGKQMHEIVELAEAYGTHVVGPPIA